MNLVKELEIILVSTGIVVLISLVAVCICCWRIIREKNQKLLRLKTTTSPEPVPIQTYTVTGQEQIYEPKSVEFHDQEYRQSLLEKKLSSKQSPNKTEQTWDDKSLYKTWGKKHRQRSLDTNELTNSKRNQFRSMITLSEDPELSSSSKFNLGNYTAIPIPDPITPSGGSPSSSASCSPACQRRRQRSLREVVATRNVVKKWAASTASRRGSLLSDNMRVCGGQLEFTVVYNENGEKIQVTIHRLLDTTLPIEIVKKRDRPRSMSDYSDLSDHEQHSWKSCSHLDSSIWVSILVRIMPSREQTSTLAFPHSTAVMFDEVLDLRYKAEDNLQYILLYVICRRGKRGDPSLLGEIKHELDILKLGLPLTTRKAIGEPTIDVNLEDILAVDEDLGDITIKLSYNIQIQILDITIEKINWLPKIGVTGKPDTSVKVCLYQDLLRQNKFCTATKKRTRNPKFKETFSFTTAADDHLKTDLLLIVRHHGLMQTVTRIGFIHIGGSSGPIGFQQWQDCFTLFKSEMVAHRILWKNPADHLKSKP